jgi:DNA polymerase-3 subunit epsilon
MSRAVAAAALACAAVALGLVAAGVAVWADLGPPERQALGELVTAPRMGLLILFGLALAVGIGVMAHRVVAPFAAGARQLTEGVRLIAHGNAAHRLEPTRSPGLQSVAEAINELAAERSKLLNDVAATVSEANARVEEERGRLAALVSELDQSVVVCNREGRILLYNAAAGALLGASNLLGLGRSVFGILDRNLVLHAVESLVGQVARREREGAQFVTATGDGRLLRVRAAPVTGPAASAGAGGDQAELTGYVLLLSDATAAIDADARHVALLQGLVEATRAALANIRAASETLTEHPEMDPPRRARFGAIIQDEAVRLSERLHAVTGEVSERLKVRWPLEEMRGEDLLTLARSRIERRTGLATGLEAVDRELWLRADSFSLAQALSYLARRLNEELAIGEVRFRLTPGAGHAQLDVVWQGRPLATETALAWQSDPFTLGGEDSPLSLAQVVERHGGEAWYQRDESAGTAYFRLLLPRAGERASARTRAPAPGRPEFYDFDLFRRSPATDALDERALADLAYTVFDTETTGLNPAEGDEIVALGAVRIVNGRLLQGETFERLVDPRRSVSEAAISVHGITPEMLRGQPGIERVLPEFHRFAEETVLVGHNAAFDMRFLQLKEAQAGVRFEQPVLDTLLLSAALHPEQASHSLEEIATRLSVAVVDRHTARGDALVTAEVFLRLLPLLAARGIRTLGEARAASESTYYARLQY